MRQLCPARPHLILLTGIPGSGKSFFAEKFAHTFNAPYINKQQISILTGIHTDAIIDMQLDELLKTRQSIILDGAATTRSERAALYTKARKAGYEKLIIWIQTDPAVAKNRAMQSKADGRPRYTARQYEEASQRFAAPSVAEKPVVLSGMHTYASQAKVILKKLSATRPEERANQSITPERPQPTAAHRSVSVRSL